MSKVETTPFIKSEAFDLFCTKEIGSGAARRVWSSALLPDVVIKCEAGGKSFQNVLEWDVWDRVQGTEFEKWFAPCIEISLSGAVLVMAKTTVPTKFPEKLPAFFTDLKRTNFGMFKGRFVCHDYGMHLMLEVGMTKRMLKADWWDHS